MVDLSQCIDAGDAPASDCLGLRELVAAIEARGLVEALWDRAIRVLDDFAAGVVTTKRWRAFWKR